MTELGSRATVADVVRVALATSVTRLAEHEEGVRAGGDPEDVHQARVAARRLRSDLRTFRDYVEPEWAAELRAELRWLGSELGHVRDVEVMIDRLRAHANLLPDTEHEAAERVIRHLTADHAAARTTMLNALASRRYDELKARLGAAARDPRLLATAGERARDELPRVVRKPWRGLRRAVDDLPDVPSDDALHQVRIRAKRCRYAAEAAEAVFGKPARKFAEGAERIQDLLGEHQDAVVAGAWLAKAAPECAPTVAYAVGMLAQVERQTAWACRDAFPDAWRAASRRKLRAWLRG
jgi:CHAD domain-containing protein